MQSLAPGAEAPMLATATPERIARWERIIADLRDKLRFFHWELEFPDVFYERGGFDAIVMNPPWEHTELKEQEFFATRAPEIAGALNTAARRRLIARLPETNPDLFAEFQRAKALADNFANFVHASGHFPLTAVGRINLYPLFAELGRRLINPRGGMGAVIPSGIATDYNTQDFFRDLMATRALSALYDFENREGIFHDIDSRMKFSLFFASGPERDGEPTDFAFFLLNPDHLRDEWRHFCLTEEEIALLNPNTRTCPIFRSRRDAELTKAIYRRHPVLYLDGVGGPWQAEIYRAVNLGDTAALALATSADNVASSPEAAAAVQHGALLRVFEAKMFHQYDHRFATYAERDVTYRVGADAAPVADAAKAVPAVQALPRLWYPRSEIDTRLPDWRHRWLLAFRNITNVTNERTTICTVLPYEATDYSVRLLLPAECEKLSGVALCANLNSFAFDYSARQSVAGTNFSDYIMKQLPVIPPSRYEEEFCGERLAEVVAGRVLELVYTAWDIRAFALDLGDEGPPFVWDEERRAQLRAQLDAIYFHLYGIERADVEYIMSTFPIVERKDRAAHGCYRTRDLILGYYDAYARGELEVWLGPEEKREARRCPSPGPSPFRGGEQV